MFLFTDIEGSTRLWEERPAVMSRALVRHDEILAEVFTLRRGHVFKRVGDAFCVAFEAPATALEAALELQTRLAAEPWPAHCRLSVRVALHAGAAESRDGDYFGQPLNRIARLLGIAHGGQILLSAAAREILDGSLPADCALEFLGEHRLKDLFRPEQVYQVRAPGLPADFPPLRSLDSPDMPNNLPQQVTTFIGREREVAEVRGLLATHRLVTLTGTGGCGKTRLALQVAAEMLEQAPGGAWLIELAPLREASEIPAAMASALGVREEPGVPVLESIHSHLREQQALLLLDNCEHLIEPAARMVDQLLRRCPKVSILASSREPLRIPGERTYRVPSLAVPKAVSHMVDEVRHSEAVRLLVDRAQFHQPTFDVSPANAKAVVQLCASLDGIPLAIELAAARIRSLSLDQINSKLDDRFRLLTGGSRAALPRQQTLKALVDWSYDLLNQQEKRLLVGLSVFAGPFSLEAAHGVAAEPEMPEWEVFDLLESLADKSLLVVEPSADGATSYRMLETVRRYGLERLAESGEYDRTRLRHGEYFGALAEEAGRHLRGRGAKEWVRRLAPLHDEMRAAISWAIESGNRELGLRLAGGLGHYFYLCGRLQEGLRLCEQVLDLPKSEADHDSRQALFAAAWLAQSTREPDKAEALFERLKAESERRGDSYTLGLALNGLGVVAEHLRRDFGVAQQRYRAALEAYSALPDGGRSYSTLNNLGSLKLSLGDYEGGLACYMRSLELLQAVGDVEVLSVVNGNVGQALTLMGRYLDGEPFLRTALDLAQELGGSTRVGNQLLNLGLWLRIQGRLDEAEASLRKALELISDGNELYFLGSCWIALGQTLLLRGPSAEGWELILRATRDSLARRHTLGILSGLLAAACFIAEHDPGLGARLLGSRSMLDETSPYLGMPELVDLEQRVQRLIVRLKGELGEDVFFSEYRRAASLTVEDLLESVQQVVAVSLRERVFVS